MNGSRVTRGAIRLVVPVKVVPGAPILRVGNGTAAAVLLGQGRDGEPQLRHEGEDRAQSVQPSKGGATTRANEGHPYKVMSMP